MKVAFNGTEQMVGSIAELGALLDCVDREEQFEFWISTDDGPALGMFRNADHGWLMYLRFNGDSGFVTKGDQDVQGSCNYRLSNGQIDEYPLSWCVDLEQGYKAIAYFFVNDGAKCDFLAWQVG